MDYTTMSPKEVRALIAKGEITGPTAGMCAGYAQANLVILPKDLAYDFLLFTQRNPRSCPLLEVSDTGSRFLRTIAKDADIATEIPRYRIYRDGVLDGEYTDIASFWQDDFVSFLIGCSFSFESAMLSLGGQTLGFSGAEQSSATKGETVADTARVVSCYADIIAMRHPKEGAPLRASMYSKVPVINAGDGGHNHPTQTLIDMMTIRQRKGRLDHLTVGFCGDLKFGRTVHSLVNSLVRYPDNQFYFISPEELRVPDYMIEDTLKPANVTYHEVTSLEDTLPKLDVLYMTRVQKERFFNEEEYIRLKGIYMLTKNKLQLAPPDMPVLHPLPRVDEISLDVDEDKRAAYFDQVQNGVYIRMALIMALLGIPDPKTGEEVLSC